MSKGPAPGCCYDEIYMHGNWGSSPRSPNLVHETRSKSNVELNDFPKYLHGHTYMEEGALGVGASKPKLEVLSIVDFL
jgi:hypothetical protein